MDITGLNTAQKYSAARMATEPTAGHGAAGADSAYGETLAKASMIGKADPHSLVQALAQTELAVEAAVTVRDRVVEAYQEILRMPV